MKNKKLERELNGPGWTEVILGAVLSLILGVILAAVFLVLKPVQTVKELPKEPDPDMVYYVPGTNESGRARQAATKEKAFVQGGSVVLNEDELNAIVAPAKTAAKPADGAETLAAEPPNFRVRNSVLQVGVPVKLSAAGFQFDVVVQARGGLAKEGDTFVFAPSEFYVGSCPIQRLPAVEGLLMKRFVAAAAVPEELVTAWHKLSDAAVEDSTVRLTMP